MLNGGESFLREQNGPRVNFADGHSGFSCYRVCQASSEGQIAYEQDVQRVSDTWLRQVVLMIPVAPPGRWLPSIHLSDGGIHSNERGSRVIAERVRGTLARIYGERILADNDRSLGKAPSTIAQ